MEVYFNTPELTDSTVDMASSAEAITALADSYHDRLVKAGVVECIVKDIYKEIYSRAYYGHKELTFDLLTHESEVLAEDLAKALTANGYKAAVKHVFEDWSACDKYLLIKWK